TVGAGSLVADDLLGEFAALVASVAVVHVIGEDAAVAVRPFDRLNVQGEMGLVDGCAQRRGGRPEIADAIDDKNDRLWWRRIRRAWRRGIARRGNPRTAGAEGSDQEKQAGTHENKAHGDGNLDRQG